MGIRYLKWILLGSVLALLSLGHSFGIDSPVPLSGQPAQMWSKIDYDPKLTDPFFKSDEWSYPYGGQVVVSGMWPEGEDPPRLKHTARCYSTSGHSSPEKNEHLVRFCDARLVDMNTIDLFIHEDDPEFVDKLTLRITKGMFTSQYQTSYKRPGIADWIWTTKRQGLALDKKAYRKGDVIKGRIDFECIQEPSNPKYIQEYGKNLTTIKVYGVFRAIVK